MQILVARLPLHHPQPAHPLPDVADVLEEVLTASSSRGRGHVTVPFTGAEAGHSLGQASGSRAPVGRSSPGRGRLPQAHKPGSGCLLSILPVCR